MPRSPSKFIKRTYRITEKQDTKVKRLAKKQKESESEIIRTFIEEAKKK